MWCYGVHLCLKQRDDRDDGRGDRADDGSGRAVALLGGRRGHRLGARRVVLVTVATAAARAGIAHVAPVNHVLAVSRVYRAEFCAWRVARVFDRESRPALDHAGSSVAPGNSRDHRKIWQ